ncbi:hypothetical protein OKW22_001359 [Bacilli bacterium PM5-3]|nr:hypothetical protein [Bacilli bacterium PM5-3]
MLIQDKFTNIENFFINPRSGNVKININGVDSGTSYNIGDLIDGIKIKMEVEETLKFYFDVTLKGELDVPNNIDLVNTAYSDSQSMSVTIKTTDKSIVISGVVDDINRWYVIIGVSSVIFVGIIAYHLRRKIRGDT